MGAEQLFDDGARALAAGLPQKALELFDQALASAADEQVVVLALFGKANACSDLGELAEAVALWKQVYGREIADEPTSQEPLLGWQARYCVARAEAAEGDVGCAVEFTGALTERLQRETNPAIQTALGEVGGRFLWLLVTRRHYEEALPVAETIIRVLGSHADAMGVEALTTATLTAWIALGSLGRRAEADPLYLEIISAGEPALAVLRQWEERLARTHGIHVPPQIVTARLMRASALAVLGRREDAIGVLDATVEEFDDDDAAPTRLAIENLAALRRELLIESDDDPR